MIRVTGWMVATLWGLSLAFYVVALLATGMAGPSWALWSWSLVAAPLFVASYAHAGVRAGRRRSAAFWAVLLAWSVIVIGGPLCMRAAERLGSSVPPIVGKPLLAVSLAWPLFVTLVGFRLYRARSPLAA